MDMGMFDVPYDIRVTENVIRRRKKGHVMTLQPVRHTCGAEVVLKRHNALLESDERTTMLDLWCPACRRAVLESELDRPGPYCATRAGDGAEVKTRDAKAGKHG